MAEKRDYYEVLGIDKNASEDEIKNIICNYLEIEKFDDITVKNHLERIEISRDEIILIPKLEHIFDIHL